MKASYYMRQTFHCQAIAELNNEEAGVQSKARQGGREELKKGAAKTRPAHFYKLGINRMILKPISGNPIRR